MLRSDLSDETHPHSVEVLDAEVAEDDVAGGVAVVDPLVDLRLDLLDHFYHHKCHVHVTFLLVAVLGVDELSESHFMLVVGRQWGLVAGVADMGGATSELLDSFLS